MRIILLLIQNFKGIKELVIDANGKNVNIYGDNATGKTTIADAFNWLLNGKDSLNRSDFGIKPIDQETQEPIHGVETAVKAALNLGTSIVTLKKVYYEKWVKERGAAEKTFSGNTTDYFIDDVPVKKAEYEGRIKEMADEKAFKLLTNPLYFNEQLHWTDKRKMLLQVCGDISNDDVILVNPKLASLNDILGSHDIEQHKKYIAARKSEINKQLDSIPLRITEVKNMMPDISGIDVPAIKASISNLTTNQNELRQEIVRIQSGGEIAEQNKKLAELNAKLIGLKALHSQKQSQALGDLILDKTGKDGKYRSLQNEYFIKQNEIAAKGRLIDSLENEINDLYAKYDAVEAEVYEHEKFSFSQDSVCPTCGQDIPQEKLDAVCDAAVKEYEDRKARAIEKFNLNKSTQLENITNDGKAKRAAADTAKAEKVKLESELAGLNEAITQVRAELDAIQGQIETVQNSFVDVAETPEYKSVSADVQAVKLAISELQNGNTSRIDTIKQSIDSIAQQITDLQSKISAIEQAEKSKARINELLSDQKKLSAEYERLESEQFTIEEFVRTKVKMLDSKINSKFKFVRFKLFDVQVNGALNECCEALINTNGCWTPYSDANAAGRINGGIDIINTLSEHFAFEAPIFIDNAESVTSLVDTKAQAFRLVVSEKDKQLRIEVEDK